MEKKYYTNERNVQIVISLLKQHGIHRVIASPGTTNMTFVGSIQNDPFFQIWSSVDERSAAYMACGMASETGEPVVLSCTGATASRNYMPGLTEAYYRKLPVLAITSHRGDYKIGHLLDQQIDRRVIPNDVALISVTVPTAIDSASEQYCIDETNKAIIALTSDGGGPVHINLFTQYSRDFSIVDLPKARCINKYTINDELPTIPNGRVGIYVGAHPVFTVKEIEAIEEFCSTYDAVVFTSHISGYRGKYEMNFSLVCSQLNRSSPLCSPDLLISIGEIEGSPFVVHGKEVWRVSPDGQIRDSYGRLTKVFGMSEEYFFRFYAQSGQKKEKYLSECISEDARLRELIPELPFSNPWIASSISERLPDNCELYLGILNSLRSWNLFHIPLTVNAKCNVGGYGIDGGISSMIGASLINPEKLYFGIFGDLGFFYDMNVLGNRHVGNNVRIMLVNNGRGTEFRNFNHPCSMFGNEADKYLAAAGHFGNKSNYLIKHYAEDLGYIYLSARNKQEFNNVVEQFLSTNALGKSVIFEVFTETKDESDALECIQKIEPLDPKAHIKNIIKRIIPNF